MRSAATVASVRIIFGSGDPSSGSFHARSNARTACWERGPKSPSTVPPYIFSFDSSACFDLRLHPCAGDRAETAGLQVRLGRIAESEVVEVPVLHAPLVILAVAVPAVVRHHLVQRIIRAFDEHTAGSGNGDDPGRGDPDTAAE